MGNESYLNHYIETLTSSLTDCVIRNVSMQANAKVTDDVIGDLSKKLEVLDKIKVELETALNEAKNNNNLTESNLVKELKDKISVNEQTIQNLNADLSNLQNTYRDYDSIKNQATHVDTFKSELIKAREETMSVRNDYEKKIVEISSQNNGKIEEINSQNKKIVDELKKQIEELNSKIEYLQLPPAKRKKIDVLNKSDEAVTTVTDLGIIKDGGSF
jgi:DNA repair exonuclease SbcCD ATPase subunit